MKFYFTFIECAIDNDLHLVTALKGLQPEYGLARNSRRNSTIAMAGMPARPLFLLQQTAPVTTTNEHIYQGRLSVVDVPRLQKESGQIAPTFPSALSYSAWSSAPWGLLRYPREPSNLLPLMGSGPALPDGLRQRNNNHNHRRASRRQSLVVKLVSLIYTTQCLFTKRFLAVSIVPFVWLV